MTSRRAATVLLALATAAGTVVPAAAAQAAPWRTAGCTITAEHRVELLDQLAANRATLVAARPTAAQRKAINDAVTELTRTARQEKLPAADRKAKKRELVALAKKLRVARTATERAAIRTEMRAIELTLRAARLTPVERAELRAEAKELRATIAPQALTGRERAKIAKENDAIAKQLRCTVVPTPAA